MDGWMDGWIEFFPNVLCQSPQWTLNIRPRCIGFLELIASLFAINYLVHHRCRQNIGSSVECIYKKTESRHKQIYIPLTNANPS
jgi:hypothetical protein